MFQSTVEVGWLPVIAYGADDLPRIAVDAARPRSSSVFNLGATPERENHGAFSRALASASRGRARRSLRSSTRRSSSTRFGGNPRRIAERQAVVAADACGARHRAAVRAARRTEPCGSRGRSHDSSARAMSAASRLRRDSARMSGHSVTRDARTDRAEPDLAHERRQDHARAHAARRDVGEVRDDAHVTDVAERYTMIETPARRRAVAVGHAGVRRQRAARAAARDARQADRRLPGDGLGPLARPRAVVEPAGGAQRAR